MNWVFILVIAILAGFAAVGYWKGLLKIVYSLVAWILILVFVTVVTPFIHDFLINHTGIYEKIEMHCEESIRKSVQERTSSAGNQALKDVSEISELGVILPESALNGIVEKAAGLAGGFVESSGLYKELASGMADFIVQGISFFIAFIIATLAAIVISGLLKAVSKIPVLSTVNRICGLCVGIVYGFLMIWIAFYLIAICSASETGAALVSHIYESRFLTYLYENNLVVTIILKFL